IDRLPGWCDGRLAPAQLARGQGRDRREYPVFAIRLLRRRPETECVGNCAGDRRTSDPLVLPPGQPFAKRLQPGGGGELSRASGMSFLSFCAKLLRHTSLVPSGPAL